MDFKRVGDAVIWLLHTAERVGQGATDWKERLNAAERLRNFDARARERHQATRTTVVEVEPADAPSAGPAARSR